MAIDLVYYYKDITNFKYSIDRWQATIGQSIIINLVAFVLPGRQRSSTSKDPHAEITIEYLSDLRQPMVKEFAFSFTNKSYEIALDEIKKKTNFT